MNIAFDATAILGPMSKNRGIGNYNLAQFREMIENDHENHYFLFNLFEPFSLGNYQNLTEEYFPCGKDFVLCQLEHNAIMGNLIRRFLENNKIDVFYITSPFDGSYPVYRKEWFSGVKTVATVYDIIPYVFKEKYFPPTGEIPEWYSERIEMLRWMDKMLVISQSVKDDLQSYLGFNGDKIEVIWGAPDRLFQKISVSESERKALQKKFRLKEQFIMCTGGDDERKNIAGLIEAYGKLPGELKDQYGLAVVCKLSQASVERYRALGKRCNASHGLVLTNFVTNEELLQLYNISTLVAFPSKYEGFGLPIVEAWACGKPVLTANNSSLCQLAGDAATLVNAEDVDDISRGLQRALQDDMLESMAKKGAERLKMFQWSHVAKLAITKIEQLKTSTPVKKEIEPLAYFTPLPPQQSGIADYSVDLLSVLADQFRIDVYIDDGYEAECELPLGVRVFNHREFPERAYQYKNILFQMGNSLYHYYMYSYLRRYGGILVLHDLNMHGVAQAVGLTLAQDNLKTYESYLREDLSEQQTQAILTTIRQGKQRDANITINGFVSNYASKIIVHSCYSKENLLKKNIGRTVEQIPHYAIISPLADAVSAKNDLLIDTKRTVFAAFGHIHETKRALPLLRAAARFLKEYPSAEFHFVGKLDPAIKEQFEDVLKKSHVSDRITVTGYTSLDTFRKYIDAADVCFNLRHPYNGENSGSLARILSRGKCVVVNNVGSFGEVPDDCCIKLPPVDTMTPKEEETLIYDTMKNLMNSPDLRQTYGRNARSYAEKELDLRVVSKKYADFILSRSTHCITEQLLRDLHFNELKNKGYSTEEIHEISKTLAYCIG